MRTILILAVLAVVFLYGCTDGTPAAEGVPEETLEETDVVVSDNEKAENVEEVRTEAEVAGGSESKSQGNEGEEVSLWSTTEFKDVRTGEKFMISDFAGETVLLESFAVWCPKCTQQQKQIRELHEEIGDSVVSISLNTDQNEDENNIRQHLDRNDFDWRYAVSPVAVTQDLIADFGVGVVNAPSVPVILVCPDQSARLLSRGVKSSSELKSEIASCNA
jgi:thiol-disulfide isomerase/thioredoxin